LHDRTARRPLQSRECSQCAFLLPDLELVKLPEDITLAGFTPLMLNPQDPCYMKKTEDMVNYATLRHVCSPHLAVNVSSFFFFLSLFRRHLVDDIVKDEIPFTRNVNRTRRDSFRSLGAALYSDARAVARSSFISDRVNSCFRKWLRCVLG